MHNVNSPLRTVVQCKRSFQNCFRSRPKNVPSITGSKDLQNVNITLRILFRPRPDSLPNIYTTLGVDYDDRVLPSITNEVLISQIFGKGYSQYSGRRLE